ncbi:MAG: hypothetical protein J1E05_01985 [Eubacterium sp.]|nr:hypothetical protein [Eubacterium sp.]
MLRDNYKKAFSQINPSEKTIERIFEMTEKKHIKRIHKGLIIAIALIAVLLCGSLTANAATDGALFEGIGHIINGEDLDLKDFIANYNSYVDKDGAKVEEYEFDMDGDGKGDSILFELKTYENSGTAIIYDLSLRDASENKSEYSEEQMEQIFELTDKIFESKGFSKDKSVTNIP